MKNSDRKLNYSENKKIWKNLFSVISITLIICITANSLMSKNIRNQLFMEVILIKSNINYHLIKLKDIITSFSKSINGNYLSELEQLQKENTKLKSKISEINLLKNENAKLKEILNMNHTAKNYAVGKIIYKNSPEWFSSITIDIGSDNNVKLNDIVFDEKGLIGKIIKVFPNKSIVLLSTDINFNVPVCFKTDNKDIKMALIRGNNNGELTIIVKHSLFETTFGEKAYTTEDGGIFPEGLYVGKINSKNKIIPPYDIEKLKFVCVKINQLDFFKFIPKIKIQDPILMKFLDEKFIRKYQIGTFWHDEYI